MRRDDVPLGVGERLREHGRPAGEPARVDLEGDLEAPLSLFRLEGDLLDVGVSVPVHEQLARLGVRDMARHRVGGAGRKPRVLDRVDELEEFPGNAGGVPGLGVRGRRRDVDDQDRLALVFDVGVDHVLLALARHGLEGDEPLAREGGAAEGEGHLYASREVLRNEGRLGGDLVAVVVERGLARFGVHQDALDRVLVSGDAAGVLDDVDDGELFARLSLMGAARGVGGRGAHGLGHVGDLDLEDRAHGAVGKLEHSLVVHEEVVDGGVALVVHVGYDVAFGSSGLLQVVGAVLEVRDADGAVLAGDELLVVGALVVPEPEDSACHGLVRVEGVGLLDLELGGGVLDFEHLVEHGDVLALVFERHGLLGDVERVAVLGLRLVDGVGPEVELAARGAALPVGFERGHDVAGMGADRAVARDDVGCRLHDVNGVGNRLAGGGVVLDDADGALLGHVGELDLDGVVPVVVDRPDRDGLAFERLDVALWSLHLDERVVALLEQHRQRHLAAFVGGPGVHDVGVGVVALVGDELSVVIEQLEGAGKRDLAPRLGVRLDDLERRLRDVVVHERRRVVLPFRGDGRLPVGDRDDVVAVLRLEGLGHGVRDDLVHRVGAVCQGARPALRDVPAVDGEAASGRREAVLVGGDGADHLAGLGLLAGLGRDDRILGCVDQLELHAGQQHALGLLHYAGFVLDLDGNLLHQTEIPALDRVGRLGRVVGVDGLAHGAAVGYLHAERLGLAALPVVEVVAGGRLGFLYDGRAEGKGGIPVAHMVEVGPRHLVGVGVVREAVGVGGEHPGARGRAGRLRLLGAGVLALVEADGELRARKRRRALGDALPGRRVDLHDEHADRVGLGVVGDARRPVHPARHVGVDLDGVDGLVEGVALGGDGLLHPVGAGDELAEPARPVVSGLDRAGPGGEPAVRVDLVDSAGEAVAGVRPADLGQRRALLERYLAEGGVLEGQDQLRAGSRAQLEGLEVLGHLARPRRDLAAGRVRVGHLSRVPEAEHVVLHPVLELLGAAVHGVVAVGGVGVGQEDVGERGVVVVAHRRPVVPPIRPHGGVEAGAP